MPHPRIWSVLVPVGVKIGPNLLEIYRLEIGVSPAGALRECEQVRTPPPRTFSHDATVLQVRSTTAQKLVVERLM